MSDTKQTADVNSELPDQDALAAFANSALGGGGRRRRNRGSQETAEQPAADTAVHAVGEEPVQPQEEQPEQKAAEPAPVAPAPAQEAKASVPSPAPAPETAPAPDPRPEQSPREQRPSTEVEVRAVPVPMTSTWVPPGLRGGTIEVQVPALGPAGARATQCTVMLSTAVRDRFAHYQLAKKMAGEKEPSNALVVRRAFLHAKRGNLFGKLLADAYHQANAVDDEDYDEDGLLGDVIGRRTVRGRLKETGQQSFRPSEQELATYDAYSQAYGFPSRSDFLDAVLDEFLPQLPASGRRR